MFIEHSLQYCDENCKVIMESKKSPLRMLNLNCCGLSAKFDKLNPFLASINTDDNDKEYDLLNINFIQ